MRGGGGEELVRGRLVGEGDVYVCGGHAVDGLQEPLRALVAVGGGRQRVVVALQAQHRALLLLQHLLLAGIRQFRGVEVEHVRRRDPDAGVADFQFHRRVHIGRAALDRPEDPVRQHHLFHRAGDVPGGVQHRLRVGIPGDEVDGAAGGQALEQLVEGLRVASAAHHVADDEYGVVVQGADLAQDGGLLVAKAPPVEVGEQQYAVALQFLRQADHGHFLFVHGEAVALQQHHQRQQKRDAHQKYRPEGEVYFAPEQAQRAPAPRRALGRAGKQPLKERTPLFSARALAFLFCGCLFLLALFRLRGGLAGAPPAANGHILLVAVLGKLVVLAGADVRHLRPLFVFAHANKTPLGGSISIIKQKSFSGKSRCVVI